MIKRIVRSHIVRKYLVSAIAIYIMIGSSGFMGYVYGFFDASNELPPFLVDEVEIVLPPPAEEIQLAKPEEVVEFLETDTTNEEEYEEGFNCVEYAFIVARGAHWQGLSAEIFRVRTENLEHMILGFPLEDETWMFVEPQTDTVLELRIGKIFMGSRILGIDHLVWEWETFMECEPCENAI